MALLATVSYPEFVNLRKAFGISHSRVTVTPHDGDWWAFLAPEGFDMLYRCYFTGALPETFQSDVTVYNVALTVEWLATGVKVT